MNQRKRFGIYLAAGKSSRMGCNKLSLPLQHSTIGSLALKSALLSRLDHIVIVTQEGDLLNWVDSECFTNELRNRWSHVTCPKASLGQAYSIHTGVIECEKRGADSIIILLADQPFLSINIINVLLEQEEKTVLEGKAYQYIAASFQQLIRPPILFSKELFPLLLQLKGDEGARKVIRNSSLLTGKALDFDDERSFFDIDTKLEYESIKGG